MPPSALSVLSAVALALGSLLFLKTAPWLAIACLGYSTIWITVALQYRPGNRLSIIALIGFALPLFLFFSALLCLRFVYFMRHGMDAPDEMASPLAFLLGLAFEAVPTYGLLTLCLSLRSNWRQRHTKNTEPLGAANGG